MNSYLKQAQHTIWERQKVFMNAKAQVVSVATWKGLSH